MKNYKTKTSFVRHAGPKAWDDNIGNNLIILILIFVENCLNAIHNFSVWLIVLILRILIGFEATVKIKLPYFELETQKYINNI